MITLHLNSWNYPYDGLQVMFAAGYIKKSTKKLFKEFWGGYKTNDAELHRFTEQVIANDHIVFHGGDTPTLLHYLRQDMTWMGHLEGKHLYCISAGISAMAYRSFNIDHKKIVDGLGIMPLQTIVHYTDDKKYMGDALYNTCKLPVLPIRDADSYIVTIDGDYCKLEKEPPRHVFYYDDVLYDR